MNGMLLYSDLRDRLLAADEYFGIEPARRARCVEFLRAFSRVEADPQDAAFEAESLWALFRRAVEEARSLIDAGELNLAGLPDPETLPTHEPAPVAPRAVTPVPVAPRAVTPVPVAPRLASPVPDAARAPRPVPAAPPVAERVAAPPIEATARAAERPTTRPEPALRRLPRRLTTTGTERRESASELEAWELVVALAE